jgi:hypothetical protein
MEGLKAIVDDNSSKLDRFPGEFLKSTWDYVWTNLVGVYIKYFQKMPLGWLINFIKFITKARTQK